MKKKLLSVLLSAVMVMMPLGVHAGESETISQDAAELAPSAQAVCLIEASSGRQLYARQENKRMYPASMTKMMGLLLIYEELHSGALKLSDQVSASAEAAGMGGSQIYLKEGETMSVEDLLKSICIASANDAMVAMAEQISGTQEAFVERMNEKAQELGMENTHFINTNGLDDENHYSSARDVAIMSRALLGHPDILKYTSIWTDELRGGKFKLANTNKLIRFYTGANGLKTGSTSSALCCLSASALRDDMQLIAVVLGAPTSAKRFSSAKALLDYGFSTYKVAKLAEAGEEVCEAEVANGVSKTVRGTAAEEVTSLESRAEQGEIEKRVYIDEPLTAPVRAGDKIGRIDFVKNEAVIDSVDITAADSVDKKSIFMIMRDIAGRYLTAQNQ